MMADMGAEVIKIEDQAGDFTRVTSQIKLDGVSAYFLAVNRNKRSIVLDLKHPDGKALFYEMVNVSDVVVDNMRPQALRRLECDFDDLKIGMRLKLEFRKVYQEGDAGILCYGYKFVPDS